MTLARFEPLSAKFDKGFFKWALTSFFFVSFGLLWTVSKGFPSKKGHIMVTLFFAKSFTQPHFWLHPSSKRGRFAFVNHQHHLRSSPSQQKQFFCEVVCCLVRVEMNTTVERNFHVWEDRLIIYISWKLLGNFRTSEISGNLHWTPRLPLDSRAQLKFRRPPPRGGGNIEGDFFRLTY